MAVVVVNNDGSASASSARVMPLPLSEKVRRCHDLPSCLHGSFRSALSSRLQVAVYYHFGATSRVLFPAAGNVHPTRRSVFVLCYAWYLVGFTRWLLESHPVLQNDPKLIDPCIAPSQG